MHGDRNMQHRKRNILLSGNALFCSNGHCGFVAGESSIRAEAVFSLLSSLLFCLCIFDLRQNGDLFEYVKKEREREPPYTTYVVKVAPKGSKIR